MQGLKKEVNSWLNFTIMAKASMYAYKDLNSFQKEFDPEAVMHFYNKLQETQQQMMRKMMNGNVQGLSLIHI